MLQAHLAPVGEHITPSVLQGGSARCQHVFADNGKPHYCSYIHAPEVVATLHPSKTTDEHLVVSYLAACVLWWHLQVRELAVVERMLDREHTLDLAQEQVVCKRLDRCIALAETMQQASALVTRYLITAAPQIAVPFRIEGTLLRHPLIQALATITTRVQAQVQPVRALPEVRRRVFEYVALNDHCRQVVLRLQGILHTSARPAMPLERLLPVELLAWSAQTLERHHPQTLTDPGDTDPLVFIVAHQLFEVWFPAMISALEAATGYLTQASPDVLAALPLVHRAGDLVKLWQRMIHLPQTMSAPDYIAFRAQLEGGSGAESEQFRIVELQAGLRSSAYRQSLEEMQLVTPRLEALWSKPSLNDALLYLLVNRTVITPEASEAQQAQELAAILLTTDADHPHVDLAALCRAAFYLDDQLWLWRQHHLAMVKAMIGSKPSMGVGEVVNHDLLTATQEACPVGGIPYLEYTTTSRLFPVIYAALNYLSEDWQAVAQRH
jgi:tryptophan 2,3-dioxygenase